MPKKISEITIEKKVRRLKRTSTGKKRYVNLSFKQKYNPTLDNFLIRLAAKFIDMFIYFAIAIVIILFTNVSSVDFYGIFSIALIVLLVINPVLETAFGKTLGKLVFDLQVINDEAKFPSLWVSYKRNFFSLVNLFALLRPIPKNIGVVKNNKHNELCDTYTIYRSKMHEINELMNINQST